MNILLLGSGGRESAIAWKIGQSPLTEKLFIAPGNGGTNAYGQNVAINPLDFNAVKKFVGDNNIDLLVVGNEDPLVEGIRDFFKDSGLLIVGPGADGARLEGSKDFAKQFMMRHDIPTARYKSFTKETVAEGFEFLETLKAPYVLKADGLAAGKGVIIVDNLEEAKKTLQEMLDGQFGQSSATVVIEEFLKGIECSVFVLTDGQGSYVTLPVAKDYKRVGEGDTGPNTGGMGSVSPVPFANDEFMTKVEERIIKPTVEGLIKEGIDYRGFIFFGLINVDGEPMVIEYNVRMGDPETESVMPRIDSDLVELMVNAAKGNLKDSVIKISPQASATVIAVSEGYPGKYAKGKEITVDESKVKESRLFHAGTALDGNRLVTNGGRVIAVNSTGNDISDALDKSYKSLEGINFEGLGYRSDIGKDLLQ